MRRFVAEARRLAELADRVPEVTEYHRRLEAVREAFAGLGDLPAALEASRQAAEEILVGFEIAGLTLKVASDSGRLNARDEAAPITAKWKEQMEVTNKALRRLEKIFGK
jgi:hypothetical protein